MKNRKLLGGGWRQGGVLAAAGIVALQQQVPLLEKDHRMAILLAEKLLAIDSIEVNREDVEINMVFWRMKDKSVDSEKLREFCKEDGIMISMEKSGCWNRLMTHFYINEEDVEKFVNRFSSFFKK
jgi:threonine aldolase